MQQVFVGIGSNIHREANILGGINTLKERFGQLLLSSVYETIPYGFEGENFYNLVAGFNTDENVTSVAAKLRAIEYEYGRSRKEQRYSSRTLDIDLLLYGDLIMDDDNIRIPREDVLEYSFVLCPLAEIAPNLLHPIVKKDYQCLWQEYDKAKDDLWKINLDLNSKD